MGATLVPLWWSHRALLLQRLPPEHLDDDQAADEPGRLRAAVVERLGGHVEGAYYAFGDYDAILILDMPDHLSAAAFSLAVSAGGAVKAVKTTPLLTVEDGIEAMRKGAGAGYRPPGG